MLMKRLLFYILLGIASYGTSLRAQTVEEGLQWYSQYESYRMAGNEAQAYDALYKAYDTLYKAAPNVSTGSSDYNTLRNLLRTMHPLMEQGIFYNQSQHQDTNALLYSMAYLDIQLMPCMRDVDLEHSVNYPTIAYNTAANTYNDHDYVKVIPYFKMYLSTGETKLRRNVLRCMLNACDKTKDYASARSIMDEIADSSTDSDALNLAINLCMEMQDYATMQRCISRALTLRPNDAMLLKFQGQAYEETQQYEKALEVFNRLRGANPRSLEYGKHIAVCNYNLGVLYYNAAVVGDNPKRNQKLSKEYFGKAATVLVDVCAAETNSLKYNQALAMAYLYSDQKGKLAAANQKVVMLGGVTVNESIAPIAISAQNHQAASSPLAGGNALAQNAPTNVPTTVNQPNPSYAVPSQQDGMMPFSTYAKAYVEERIGKWQQKDPYETASEYQERVTKEKRDARVKELVAEAQKAYIANFTKDIQLGRGMKLQPYDAENRVFLVESEFGELIVPVPRENNEARSFEANWSGMQFSNPQFYIDTNDRLALSALTFTTPSGKSYQFSSDRQFDYTNYDVNVQFEDLDNNLFAVNNSGKTAPTVKHRQQSLTVGQSDVDVNIPETKKKAENTFAVIISNENYTGVTAVPMALNDGETFAKYCEKTLGLPANNVRLYKDASYGVMIRAMRDIASIASAYQGNIDVIFYYAGHGIPNESTKDAYLLPIDADGSQTEGCYPLSKLYGELGGLGARSVLVFLDACFSGAKRDGGMLASARGVALKAKKEDPRGNMVIFSAASDDETAMPYEEKQHGLFTYFLLKKLQEEKGDVTLSALADYISRNVRQQATVVNHKPQTPSVVPSTSLADTWQRMKVVGK